MLVSFRRNAAGQFGVGKVVEAVKFNATESNGVRKIGGLAVVYGPLSDDRGGFRVRIAKDAARFMEPCVGLYNHNPDLLLGNTANQTLQITNREDGIYVEMILPKVFWADAAFTLVKDGYVNGASFTCLPDELCEYAENGITVVEYKKMLVSEFTITYMPSFVETVMDVIQDQPQTADQAQTEYARQRIAMQSLTMRMLGAA
jgi:HK97 family phage prohead protease